MPIVAVVETEMKLNDEKKQLQLQELRKLWCKWDPIGVTVDPDWPQDEYDSYLVPSLKLLESCANEREITEYLESVVAKYMGLGQQGIEHSKPSMFSKKLCAWYKVHWHDK